MHAHVFFRVRRCFVSRSRRQEARALARARLWELAKGKVVHLLDRSRLRRLLRRIRAVRLRPGPGNVTCVLLSHLKNLHRLRDQALLPSPNPKKRLFTDQLELSDEAPVPSTGQSLSGHPPSKEAEVPSTQQPPSKEAEVPSTVQPPSKAAQVASRETVQQPAEPVSKAAAESRLNRLFSRKANGALKVPERLANKWHSGDKAEIRAMFEQANFSQDLCPII